MSRKFFSLDDLTNLPKPQWLIEGLFEVNSLVMLYGPPASYKSFLVLDWVLSMATARKWHNHPTIPSKVLYVLGEGKSSLLKRVETWIHYYNVGVEERDTLNQNFRVTFDVPQFASKASVDNLLAGLEADGFKPDVIVVDTFARSFVGMDENSQKDTGLWVESADRMRQLGYTVIFLHHTAKNTEFGLKYRGSTAIMGAMDTAFALQKDYQMPSRVILTCTKQKDHDEGDPTYFQRLIVTPNPREEGSIILVPTVKMDDRFTPEYQKAGEIMESLIADPTFTDDTGRAEKLAALTGMTLGAAKTRLSRRRKG